MAEVIIIEIDADPGLYATVNAILGVDPDQGTGDWPEGLLSHVGSAGEDTIVVVEAWESRAHQEAFMSERLGPALGAAGVPEPKRAEWLDLMGRYST